jgi:hypothetical protein
MRDKSEVDGARIKPLNVPRPVLVEADERGLPVAVVTNGVLRNVTQRHDTWRIDDEWWRSEISRRYWDVETVDGKRLTVYRDLVSGEWFGQSYGVRGQR